MGDKDSGSISIGSISGSSNFSIVGSGSNVTTNNVIASGTPAQEILLALNQRVDVMTSLIAEIAHTHKLQQQQVQLLATDLARIKQAITAPEPDEGGFKSAAADLWGKLSMIGSATQAAKGLAEGILFIAGTLGWKLVLPGL
ncbi:MAG: hypothetical protein AB7S70_08395 [Hyphomicrobium sp.]|uniref:hypothetical protein n=1 Tax=Hyphomicrobium sp. TaxID=82 RepID=UPI003D1089C9